MKEYQVNITRQAQVHMRQILDYIKFHLHAPDAATKLLNLLKKEIFSLNYFPNRIVLVSEEPWRTNGIRKMSVSNYLIYFWIDEEQDSVHILAIVPEKCSQSKYLTQFDFLEL